MTRTIDWLQPSAAGRRLGVTGNRMRQIEREGRIKSIRVGNLRFYDPRDVEKLITERARRAAERKDTGVK